MSDGTLDDLIRDVTVWHRDHFGHAPMDWPLAQKLAEEAIEFKTAVGSMAPFTEWTEEAADVLIVLCAWAGRNGVDLLDVAYRKLEIVKGRNQMARDAERGITRDPADVSDERAVGGEEEGA
jgi:phosphoribosyl-ATP pyrophosphohydrolase